jgi:hypothetical protein
VSALPRVRDVPLRNRADLAWFPHEACRNSNRADTEVRPYEVLFQNSASWDSEGMGHVAGFGNAAEVDAVAGV